MIEATSQLEQIASRASSLYSRPTVAMELVRLTEEPRVDAQKLKACVAQDPALACKVLRVVNSSLFGLNRPVADLNQAIGLLGIKPLKLLVLGFNLPDELFAEAAARELQWYWTNTLTRAVAARMLAEQVWRMPGDEAFIAGLLQDIGILVLLRELGEPYAKFLTGVITEKCHLASLEHDTLGFDHVQLSAALLARWQLPQRLVEAIAMPKRPGKLARLNSPEADLPQILHLAEMLVQLVGQQRLGVLGELLEAGRFYRGMTKKQLAALVEGLQPQVDQLAQVLALELTATRDYRQTLLEAHRQMAELSEQITRRTPSGLTEDESYSQLLAHTNELSGAMQNFLSGRLPDSHLENGDQHRDQHAAHEPSAVGHRPLARAAASPNEVTALTRRLTAAATRCRDRRQELSLLIVEPNLNDTAADPRGETASHQLRRALEVACADLNQDSVSFVSLSDRCTAAVIANCERRAAIAVGHNAIDELDKLVAGSELEMEPTATISIGVATASVVPKNFDPTRMIESATRCLSAARACGSSTVKSIEV